MSVELLQYFKTNVTTLILTFSFEILPWGKALRYSINSIRIGFATL